MQKTCQFLLASCVFVVVGGLRCTDNNFFPCEIVEHEIFCAHKSWICDGMRDCIDGKDEMHCGTHGASLANNTQSPFFPSPNPDEITFLTEDITIKDIISPEVTTVSTEDTTTKDIISPEVTTVSTEDATTKDRISLSGGLRCTDDNFFPCEILENEVFCAHKSWICDGMRDCIDGKDEMHCGAHNGSLANNTKSPFFPSPSSEVTSFSIEGTTTTDIISSEITFTTEDTTTKDIINPEVTTVSTEGTTTTDIFSPEITTFTTEDTTTKDIISPSGSQLGDSLEQTIDSVCQGFRCYNQACILSELVCNGINDCGDLSDETACRNQSTSCHEFFCFNGGSCWIEYSSRRCRCRDEYEGERCEAIKLMYRDTRNNTGIIGVCWEVLTVLIMFSLSFAFIGSER